MPVRVQAFLKNLNVMAVRLRALSPPIQVPKPEGEGYTLT